MPFINEVTSIFIQRFYTGWITLRNQLTTPIKLMGRRVIELYDALIGGNDWEVTPLLSLKRRAGHTLYAGINYAAMFIYSWKSNTQGTIPIIDTTGDIEYVNSSGTTTVITTKGPTTGQNSQSSILGIGNFLYVSNPQSSFKWDGPSGTQGVTNWGIAAAGAAADVIGPNLAGAGANSGGSGVAWTNPNNVTSAVSFATVTLPHGTTSSQGDNATTFGFSIPATTSIVGIQVSFDGSCSTGAGAFRLFLLKGGVITGGTKVVNLTSSTATYTVGGASDLWGNSFTAGDVSSTTFGVQIFASQSSSTASSNYSLRHVQITIYGLGGPSVSPTGSGSFSAVNGYSYVTAYGNAVTGEVSNASLISVNTGPFSSKAYVGVNVVASMDPQVNQIRVYRTTDSGGGNQFFEISNSPFPNTTATIQDTTPDTSLQVTSQAEINLGNTPPPAGLVNLEWWSGRMWGTVGNLLYASTGPETLAGTAPNSNWNPIYQFVIPGVLVRLVAWTSGLLVFTQDDCYIVRGTDITNYTINEFIKDFGIRTYNAIDTDGTNVYVFTSDRQFICLSSTGANDVGMAIADQLMQLDPTSVYVKVNRYGLDSVVRILSTVPLA